MQRKTIESKFGPLQVVERLKNIYKIQCYICSNDLGVFFCKIYQFPDCEKLFLRELYVMKALSTNESYLQLLEEIKTPNSGSLIFKFSGQTPLEIYIKENASFDSNLLISNLVTIISQLHSANIVYGNLCPEAIFIDANLSVKLGSFEFSKNIDDDQEKNPDAEEFGNKDFQAPEYLGSGFDITLQADM